MENITIGTLEQWIGTVMVFIGFFGVIYKWYKTSVSEKISKVEFDNDRKIQELETKVDNKFIEFDERLDYVEQKRDEYEAEVENSKSERMILMGGLLSALKGLNKMGCDGPVTKSINEIEKYMMEKSH